MSKRNPENERIKRAYMIFKSTSDQKDPKTLDKIAAAIFRYEEVTRFKSFKTFTLEDAKRYGDVIKKAKHFKTGKPLAYSTVDAEMRMVREFFKWLPWQKGYKSKLSPTDADYFNNSAKSGRIAHAQREIRSPSMEQCAHAFKSMPNATIIDRRNKAVFAFLMLTGARDGAIASLKLKHIDLVEGQIFQDPREVQTKNGNTFYTWFFPVADEYRECFEAWAIELREDHLLGPDDPLFPKPKIEIIKGVGFQATGLSSDGYSNAQFIRNLIKDTFVNAGLFPFVPHSFRKTLVKYGDQVCETREQFKAWSMNLGHAHIATTLGSYLQISVDRQGELIKALKKKK